MLFLLNTRDTFVNEIRVPRPVSGSKFRLPSAGWLGSRRPTRDSGSELREESVSVYFRVREYNVLLRMTYHSVSHIK